MTPEDMIANFLASNEVTKCPDIETVSTGQSRKSNTRGSVYTAPQFYARTAKKFNCVLCGREDSIVKINPKYPNAGVVGGVYRGDVWCERCRKEKYRILQAQKKKALEHTKDIAKYGSKELLDLSKTLLAITTANIQSMETVLELSEYISDVEKATEKFKNKTLVKRCNVAVKVKAAKLLRVNKDTDWDDWDTPLHIDID